MNNVLKFPDISKEKETYKFIELLDCDDDFAYSVNKVTLKHNVTEEEFDVIYLCVEKGDNSYLYYFYEREVDMFCLECFCEIDIENEDALIEANEFYLNTLVHEVVEDYVLISFP